jgi:cell wall-associated NlpC family hydrolase
MRRIWLARAALAAVAVGVPVAGVAGVAQAAPVASAAQSAAAVHLSFNQQAATYVKNFIGDAYAYGGTSPAGFDCSGLTQYVYHHLGKNIQRTADEQFHEFRPISKSRAWGGDLVFFHDSSDPNSYVYHVGIYEGGDSMVAATTYGEGVQWQSFAWAGNTVTFGTITH